MADTADAEVDIERDAEDDTRVTQREARNQDAQDGGDEDSAENKRNNVYFHLVMMLAAAYMAMLFTNWGTGQVDGTTKGVGSFWANVSAQWITIILYYWTLVAQLVMPERFD